MKQTQTNVLFSLIWSGQILFQEQHENRRYTILEEGNSWGLGARVRISGGYSQSTYIHTYSKISGQNHCWYD